LVCMLPSDRGRGRSCAPETRKFPEVYN